jgi:hypothetical protein
MTLAADRLNQQLTRELADVPDRIQIGGTAWIEINDHGFQSGQPQHTRDVARAPSHGGMEDRGEELRDRRKYRFVSRYDRDAMGF